MPPSLQLDLWRAACRHIDLAESLPDIAAAMRRALPIARVRVFQLHDARCSLVASDPPDAQAFTVTGEAAARIARFVRRGGLTTLNTARPGQSLLAPLAPSLGHTHAVCGSLQRDGVDEGLVAWIPADGFELTDAASELLAESLEPIAAALDTARRFHELEALRRTAEADRTSALRRLGRDTLTEPIVGADAGLRTVMERASVVANSDVPVLILGETGSGKEVVARAIHERSPRHAGPFIRVNCGAIPPDLIDSQLFGHERGAFTGATERRLGWFERADGGTLFLDEIAELPLAAQVRLLRVLQEHVLERVGGEQPVRVDCRIVAATHRDLAQMVRDKQFREDLWYRVSVFPLVLPPLRERRADLPALVAHFAHRAAVRFGLPEPEIDAEGMRLLAEYPWPGNIRELASVLDRAALLSNGQGMDIAGALGAALPPATSHRKPLMLHDSPQACHQRLEDMIREAISSALHTCRGKVEGPGGAAVMLGMNPNTLRSKMRKLGIARDRV